MAKTTKVIAQDYPRVQDENSPYHGCLDDATLVPHKPKVSVAILKKLIRAAIDNANNKSSRTILSLPDGATQQELDAIYVKEGKQLFKYFRKYCGDPASTAHQIHGKHYSEVGREQFHNRTLQKERMNSGWRYQFLAVDCARQSKRFESVSDIGTAEADFNAIIKFVDTKKKPLVLYVSVKNRSNTMGGQDWPKAIHALENFAINDKNRTGPYCCVFGIAMERGFRIIKRARGNNQPHSVNTEIWLSDFFWPFFANYSYEEIMAIVLDVLMESYEPNVLPNQIEVPDKLLMSFGSFCRQAGLLGDDGRFHDPRKLVSFFCQ